MLAIDSAPVTIEATREGDQRARVRRGLGARRGRRARAPASASRSSARGPAGLAAARAAQPRRPHRDRLRGRDARRAACSATASPTSRWRSTSSIAGSRSSRAEGVEFRCGVAVGDDPTWKQLRADHDAVVIAIGAQRAARARRPGPRPRRRRARDGLPRPSRTRSSAASARARGYDVHGKRVIILGGGDTGSDCLGTAHRQGAAHVTQIELMPAPPAVARARQPVAARGRSCSARRARRKKAASARSRSAPRASRATAASSTALHGVRVELQDGKLVDIPGSELRLAGRHADPRARLRRPRDRAARRAARRRARRARQHRRRPRSSRPTCRASTAPATRTAAPR